MGCYRYDGSFEGFLCSLGRALEAGDGTALFEGGAEEQPELFGETATVIPTERERALAVRESFVARVSPDAFAWLRYAFHSGRKGVEALLWEYLRLGYAQGPRLCSMLADRRVDAVQRLARRVSGETHRYQGFVRFREVEQGFLYARIEPEADILPLLAPHFVRRINDRPWVIHDLRRCRAALYDLGSWRLVDWIALNRVPDYTPAEEECADLWRRYFRRLAIGERRNPGLQRQNVPLRDRTYLVEFMEE